MSKLVHIWIDDNVNKALLDNNYAEKKYYPKGEGDIVKMDCLYQGYDAVVYFYNSTHVTSDYQNNLAGMGVQKAIINIAIPEDILLTLMTRLRSEILPQEGTYPTEEKFVMEIGDGWDILDAHKGGNHREFKSFKDVTSAGEFLGLVRGMGCPLDKRGNM